MVTSAVRAVIGGVATVLALLPGLAHAQDLAKLKFGTNWLAEAEHGGFYQAVADGTYKKYGLDVEIGQGRPQANNGILLPAGKIDFYRGGNMIEAFPALKEGVPIIVTAPVFQKE